MEFGEGLPPSHFLRHDSQNSHVRLVELPERLMILADRGIAPEKDPSVAGCGDAVTERQGTDVGVLAKLSEGQVLVREIFHEQPTEVESCTTYHGSDSVLRDARCECRLLGRLPRNPFGCSTAYPEDWAWEASTFLLEMRVDPVRDVPLFPYGLG